MTLPKGWKYKHVPPYLVHVVLQIEPRTFCCRQALCQLVYLPNLPVCLALIKANGLPSQSKTYLIIVIVISPVLQERKNWMSWENCGGE